MTEYYAFIDESGEDNLANIDPKYPAFVIGAVICKKAYHDSEAYRRFGGFKQMHGMTPGMILHTADMVRARHGYEFLADKNTRIGFYSSLNQLVHDTEFTFISALLDKQKAVDKWGSGQRSPYIYLLGLLLERIFFCLRGTEGAKVTVIAEARQSHQDAIIQYEFAKTLGGATYIRPVSKLMNMFEPTITFLGKSANPGAEIVDLCVTPIGRWYLGGESQTISREVVDRKTYQHPTTGETEGYGRIVQPKVKSPTPA